MTTSAMDSTTTNPDSGNPNTKYWRFAAMIATSTAVMFVLMYLNTYQASHLRWSETRFYMAFVMGAAMAVVMLSFMLGMYGNRKLNLAIYAGAVVIFGLALWLVRSQVTVGDTSYACDDPAPLDRDPHQ